MSLNKFHHPNARRFIYEAHDKLHLVYREGFVLGAPHKQLAKVLEILDKLVDDDLQDRENRLQAREAE